MQGAWEQNAFQVFLNCGASREGLFPEVLLRRGWGGCSMLYGGAVFGGERNFAVVTVREVSRSGGVCEVCECEAEIWDERGLGEGKAIVEVGAPCKNAGCVAVGIPGGGGSV